MLSEQFDRAAVAFRSDRVTTDVHGVYPRAICTVLGRTVRHRTSAYLDASLEQDHPGFKSHVSAISTIVRLL
jgi:transposase-like protein